MSEAVVFGGYVKRDFEGIVLKRCPHCNGEAGIVWVDVVDADTYEKNILQRGAVIECKKCGCMSSFELVPYTDFDDFVVTAKAAATAWNMRAKHDKETM